MLKGVGCSLAAPGSRPAAFVRDRSGATAIEYALIASIISIVIVATTTQIGTKLNAMLQLVANAFA